MQIVEIAINEIKPYEHNPRKNDASVAAVAESIRQFGFKVPIVIDRSGTIVAGHTRYKAAKRLGMKTVPCIVADDLTDTQIKAFRLADNKVGESSAWDFDVLSGELLDLDNLGIDMSVFGFDTADVTGGVILRKILFPILMKKAIRSASWAIYGSLAITALCAATAQTKKRFRS